MWLCESIARVSHTPGGASVNNWGVGCEEAHILACAGVVLMLAGLRKESIVCGRLVPEHEQSTICCMHAWWMEEIIKRKADKE